jgi:hypothetical protein
MKTLFLILKNTTSLTLGIILAGMFNFSPASLAQVSNSDSDGYQSNEKDALYGGDGFSLNPMELIHRANLNNGRSGEEFEQESQQNMSTSAADFRKQQLERLNNRSSTSTPTSTPSTPQQ